jgi:hypothetical protein
MDPRGLFVYSVYYSVLSIALLYHASINPIVAQLPHIHVRQMKLDAISTNQ